MADEFKPQSCCPPKSHGYLAANPTEAAGSLIKIGSLDAYAVGTQTGGNGIIMIPDVWGYNSGRIREVAGQLATKLGAYVVIPRVLSNAPENLGLEGGTDGDGLPPDFDPFGPRGKEMGGFMGNFGWSGGAKYPIKPKFDATIAHMKEKGCTKIAGIGFCFGCGILLQASDAAKDLVCCAFPHPSCHAMLGTKKAVAMASTAQCPMLIMAAGNDPDIYDPDKGTFFANLKAKNPGSISSPFPDMLHGWTIRGDLADAKIKRDVDRFMDETVKYFGNYLTAAKM